MYDFPNSPAENDEFSTPQGQTYIYKSPRWLVKGVPPTGGGSGGGIAEAPEDGQQYARQDADWSVVVPGVSDWADITGKPTTFPPTVPIDWSNISGTPVTYPPTLPIDWGGISGKPSSYPPDPHNHTQTEVLNLTTDLATMNAAIAAKAPLASPVFTGDPRAPTPATADNDTSVATTAFVKAQGYAPLASPVFTGDPTAPTPATADNDTSVATTAFVKAQGYLGDAPNDTNAYGRKAAAWVDVAEDVSSADFRFMSRRAGTWLDLHAYVDPLHIRQWQYTASTTASAITTGQVRPNNLTLSLATALYFHKVDMSAQAGAATFIANLVKAGTTLGISTSGDPDAWIMYRVTGAPVFTDPYYTVPVAYVSNGANAISSGSRCICTFYPGSDDKVSVVSSPSHWDHQFSTVTTFPGMPDGTIRFNNASMSAVTHVCLSAAGITGGGNSSYMMIKPGKSLLMEHVTDREKWVKFDITAVNFGGTYDCTVIYGGGAGTFADGDLFVTQIVPRIGPIISDAAPTSTTGIDPGTMWWDSNSGNLYIYYFDGSSSQWVQVNTVGT